MNNMISIERVSKYCNDDISLIENYDKAINDHTQIWHCHHRGEILPCGRYSYKTLMKYGLYYHLPASELIFLTKSEHHSLHHKGKMYGSETRRKISESKIGKPNGWIGRHHNEETRRKLSEYHKGKHPSEETRRKLSEAHKGNKSWTGKHPSEETRRKISEAIRGRKRKPHSEETRMKISLANKAYWAKKKGLA